MHINSNNKTFTKRVGHKVNNDIFVVPLDIEKIILQLAFVNLHDYYNLIQVCKRWKCIIMDWVHKRARELRGDLPQVAKRIIKFLLSSELTQGSTGYSIAYKSIQSIPEGKLCYVQITHMLDTEKSEMRKIEATTAVSVW